MIDAFRSKSLCSSLIVSPGCGLPAAAPARRDIGRMIEPRLLERTRTASRGHPLNPAPFGYSKHKHADTSAAGCFTSNRTVSSPRTTSGDGPPHRIGIWTQHCGLN